MATNGMRLAPGAAASKADRGSQNDRLLAAATDDLDAEAIRSA